MKKVFLKSFLSAVLLCGLVSFAQQLNLDPLSILSRMQFRGIATMTFVDRDGSAIPEETMTINDNGSVTKTPYFLPIENGRLQDRIEYVVRIGYKNLNKATIVVSNMHAWVLCINQKSKDFSVKDWSMVFSDYIRSEDNTLRPFYNKYWSGELLRDINPDGPRESAVFRSTLPADD
ncbi:MAG: hypothetical protein IKO40_04365, partial [Kiritimatiellae bacterium]|nr:hypothetical protein [Kiritimatiellia bacterium]